MPRSKFALFPSFSKEAYGALIRKRRIEGTKYMERAEVRGRLEAALQMLVANDAYLLVHDLGERCIASRLAMWLQNEFRGYTADAEYNRAGDIPKRLGLPAECANYRDERGNSLVVPDVIVHRRGPAGPNILVLEVKKTSNPCPRDCDRARVHAFREKFRYEFGALIECETRPGHDAVARTAEWFGE